MAFHFQPQGHSSDEEAVDLTSWKAGTKKSSPPIPFATINGAASEDEDELVIPESLEVDAGVLSGEQLEGDGGGERGDDDEDEVVIISDARARSKELDDVEDSVVTPELSVTDEPDDEPFGPSFTAVNRSKPQSRSEPVDESSTVEQLERNGRILVPIITPASLEELNDDILDFTTGSDVVRKVNGETKSRSGSYWYQVEFQDRHVEEVSNVIYSLRF